MRLRILALLALLSPSLWSATVKAETPQHLQQLLRSNRCPACDLSGANLAGARLKGADLQSASLKGANLQGANLRDANLSSADLRGADLYRAIYNHNTQFPRGFDPATHRMYWIGPGASLAGANLRGVDLSQADLSQALLAGADLRRANLTRANLSRADLVNANLGEANLIGANLIGTNLIEADLRFAILGETPTVKANPGEAQPNSPLLETEPEEARLCNTILPSGNISQRDCS